MTPSIRMAACGRNFVSTFGEKMPISSTLRLVDKFGHSCTLRRLGAGGIVSNEAPDVKMLRINVRAGDAAALVGEVAQFDAKFTVKVADIACFDDEPRRGDKIVDSRGRIFTVEKPEDITIEDGAVGGYHLWARGH